MYKVFQFNLDPNDLDSTPFSHLYHDALWRRIIRLDLIYDTVKEIPTEMQSTFGISANTYKGINSIEPALRPGYRILYDWVSPATGSFTRFHRLNMKPIKIAYAILECV